MIAGLGVVGAVGAAEAATTTPQCASFAERTTFSGIDLTFGQFDPSLGELQSVELSIRLGVTWDDRVEIDSNPLGNPYTITATRAVTSGLIVPGLDVPVTTTATGSYVVDDINSEGAIEEPIGTDAGGGDVPGDDGFRRIGSSSETLEANSVDDPTPYVGTGQVEVTVSAVGTSNFDGADNAAILAVTTATGQVCVQYTYIPYVSVGDYVWLDVDRDGIQDGAEPPIDGVTMRLTGDGTREATTSGGGLYAFRDLLADAAYEMEVVPPAGYSLTTRSAPGSTPADDSGFDRTTRRQAFVAPASGANLASPPDDPTIDAGLVAFDLALSKRVVTPPPYTLGQQVEFELVPSNLGPTNALPGWSVTDLVPEGLALVSMSGSGYECSGTTCTSGSVLPAGASAAPIRLVVTVQALSDLIRNVAYVAPSPDDVPEIIPLDIPAPGTDTTATSTNNDAHADIANPRYDLALVKTVARSPIGIGELAVFTVRVRNQGDVASGQITVVDQVPPGTRPEFISAGGTYDSSSRRVTWTVSNIAPRTTIELELRVAIVDAERTRFTNTAEISSDRSAQYGGDIDSTADADLTNDVLVDQTEFLADGYNDPTIDEDDHDIAVVEVVRTPQGIPTTTAVPVPTLPRTGSSGTTGTLPAVAGLMVLVGLGSLVAVRRRS